jgi:Zn-dependent protease with chaperone function
VLILRYLETPRGARRATALGLAFVLTLLLILSHSIPLARATARGAESPSAAKLPSDEPAERVTVPVPVPSPKAVRFHQTGLYLWAAARVWDAAVPLALLLTGASARLRDAARKLGRAWFPTVTLYAILYLLVIYLAGLPLDYYAGYVRQHAYGLSRQTIGKWWGDSLKELAVSAVGTACVAWVPFFLIARRPRFWWLILAGLYVPFVSFVMLIAPVWIDPLFNDFGPMRDKRLEREIVDLAGRAGISGGRVFEVNKSVDTVTSNAYVKGLFATKRIVLWDTLLKESDDREVLAVMGHEMGHYTLNHIPQMIALSTVLTAAGLFWTDRAGRWLVARYGPRFGIDSLADVAATPLLFLLIGASSVVLGPVALAFSRHCEHQADVFSLDLTHYNASTARAFATLQRQNLSVPYRGPIETILRSTHPSLGERIEFCNGYRPWDAVRPLEAR